MERGTSKIDKESKASIPCALPSFPHWKVLAALPTSALYQQHGMTHTDQGRFTFCMFILKMYRCTQRNSVSRISYCRTLCWLFQHTILPHRSILCIFLLETSCLCYNFCSHSMMTCWMNKWIQPLIHSLKNYWICPQRGWGGLKQNRFYHAPNEYNTKFSSEQIYPARSKFKV